MLSCKVTLCFKIVYSAFREGILLTVFKQLSQKVFVNPTWPLSLWGSVSGASFLIKFFKEQGEESSCLDISLMGNQVPLDYIRI